MLRFSSPEIAIPTHHATLRVYVEKSVPDNATWEKAIGSIIRVIADVDNDSVLSTLVAMQENGPYPHGRPKRHSAAITKTEEQKNICIYILLNMLDNRFH